MFGIKTRRRMRQLAREEFAERQKQVLDEARRVTNGMLGVTDVKIAKRSCPDRMGVGAPLIHVATWCLVIHVAHPHFAGAATAAMPDRMHDFPVRVESIEAPSNGLLSTFIGWARARA
jgi:hypothetical protein